MSDLTDNEVTTRTERDYTDDDIVNMLELKAAKLKEEINNAQQKADSLLKDAKEAQLNADKLKTRFKIMKRTLEAYKNTIEPEKKNIDIPKEKEILTKVLVVGDIGTGKTSIIKRTVHNKFEDQYKATIGVDFGLKVMKQNDISCRIQLWDIAGQERYGNMTRVYYQEAIAAFVVFDVTRPATLEGAIKWKFDIDQKVRLPDSDNEDPIPVILLANKSDLIKDDKICEKTSEEIDEFCKKHGFLSWYKVSAKDDVNIQSAIDEINSKIIEFSL